MSIYDRFVHAGSTYDRLNSNGSDFVDLRVLAHNTLQLSWADFNSSQIHCVVSTTQGLDSERLVDDLQ